MPTFNLPKNYFAHREESAFLFFIDPQTSDKAREEILNQVLYQPLFHLTESVALRYVPCVGVMGEDELVAQAFEDLRRKLHKFTPWRMDKTGRKVLRAYSYLSAIVKNFSMGYGKKAGQHEARHVAFDGEAQEWLETTPAFRVQADGNDTGQAQARDERLQRVLSAIRSELSQATPLRPNEVAVGLALLAVLEVSAAQPDGWHEDERITAHNLRRLLLASVAEHTRLSGKEINLALRRFQMLYELVCEQEEDAEPEEDEYGF